MFHFKSLLFLSKTKFLAYSLKQLVSLTKLSGCFLFLFPFSCTEPVTPDFQYKEGLIFIEAVASTSPGSSFVIINESTIEFGVYVVNFVKDATINFENIDTGEKVSLQEFDEAYLPLPDFKIEQGENWKLRIEMPNGKKYESSPEEVAHPVPITNLRVSYNKELEFREVYGGKFVPGHEILVSFDDPVDRDNYYYWSYRTYENLDICEKCIAGYFRSGECIDFSASVSGIPYFDYLCDSHCWRIRFPESIAIFDDKFSNGLTKTDLSIGNILLYTKEDMVIEVQQMALSSAAHKYYKVLKDIMDNNSGLNAPPPAALVGNLFNPDDSEDFVFGRFTAAATSTMAIFVDRTNIVEQPLERKDPLEFETFDSPVPSPTTTTAPCSENRFRTAIPPNNWIGTN